MGTLGPEVHVLRIHWLWNIRMDRHPRAQEDCGDAAPYNAQQRSTVINILALGRCARFIDSWKRQGPRREQVDEEEEEHDPRLSCIPGMSC